jgi:hypothetical protein
VNVTSEIEKFLTDAQLSFTRTENVIIVTIPGTHKLSTTCSISIGASALTLNAFVSRKPDENHEEVYRWLLERNLKMYGVYFAVDNLGDIYLAGRVPLRCVDEAELDRLIGCVSQYSDGAFNTILELGFASAIRKEWQWRVSRGESTENLDAFAHLIETQVIEPQA